MAMNTRAPQSNGSRSSITRIFKCEHCQDMGFILEERPGTDYGDCYHGTITFAIPCPHCKGIDREQNKAQNGVPLELSRCYYPAFNWSVYDRLEENTKLLTDAFFNGSMREKGLYIWSAMCGSGKTMLACSLLNSIMIKESVTGQFITSADYLEVCKVAMKRNAEEADPLKKYFSCDILVIDDIGAVSLSAWACGELLRLIDRRYSNGLITCYTSNIQRSELNIDQRIKDRIYATTYAAHMPEESIRAKRASIEQRKAMERLRANAAR